MSRGLKILLHILFLVGIIITITGWFFDRTKHFDWIVLRIAPDYVSGKRALIDLKKNNKIALTTNHEGFQMLINKWPNLSKKEDVRLIGRTVAFVSFGAEVSSDIEIIAYDKDKNEIKERWKMSEADAAIESIIEEKLFNLGTLLFWGGIVVSIVSYIISLKANFS